MGTRHPDMWAADQLHPSPLTIPHIKTFHKAGPTFKSFHYIQAFPHHFFLNIIKFYSGVCFLSF